MITCNEALERADYALNGRLDRSWNGPLNPVTRLASLPVVALDLPLTERASDDSDQPGQR